MSIEDRKNIPPKSNIIQNLILESREKLNISGALDVLSFDELRTEAMQSDPQLQTLRSDQTTALRQVSVNKAKGLPGFELGYRMNPASGGERFNGFLVGITIPLFSNRNNVKQAKAQARYTEMQLESASFTVENGLRQLYDSLSP